MFVSKLGRTLVASTLALAAAPPLAAETLPLDETALGQVTALGIGNLAILAWLPEPGDRSALLPAAMIETDSTPANGLALDVMRSDHGTIALDRQCGRGSSSYISQTAAIHLPTSQAAAGVIMQSTGNQFGGQNATNLAVAATLNGIGTFGSIRP